MFDKSEEEYLINKIKMLRKIDGFDELYINSTHLYFEPSELEIISTLLSEGKLELIFDSEYYYDEEQKIVITQNGRKMLFCADNASLIIEFCEALDELGYDTSFNLIMDFIDTQNLKLDASDVLTIENFVNFSILNERNILKNPDDFEEVSIFKVLKLSYKLRNDK